MPGAPRVVAPASRRWFYAPPQGRKSPARRRRYQTLRSGHCQVPPPVLKSPLTSTFRFGKVGFAELLNECKNTPMRRSFIAVMAMLTVGMMIGNARAQPAPAANPSATPPAKTAMPPAKKAPAESATKPGTPSTAGKTSAGKTLTLTTPNEKASYAIGLNVGKGMKRDSVEVNPEILLQGMKDGLSGGKQLLSDDEIKAVLTALQAHIRKMQDERGQQLGETNKKEGVAFLAANKTKEGVVTLPDGLQYKILTEGKGPKPTATDSVVCNYRGTLINGTEFDSSIKRGQPATF